MAAAVVSCKIDLKKAFRERQSRENRCGGWRQWGVRKSVSQAPKEMTPAGQSAELPGRPVPRRAFRSEPPREEPAL